ncbi:GGDEF domain-containing protein [Altererythrobacter sp. Z27]|uniref:GGDEF domain-containing protein n=1 Tax=Altererythrobacter sp. Z27 TaxID=3461147 RepID=UPI0040447D96
MSQEPSPHSFALREEIDLALATRSDYAAWSPALKALEEEYSRNRVYEGLRFQILFALAISLCALLFDAFALPDMIHVALLWRSATIVPLAVAGLFLLRKHQVGQMKLVAAGALISIGMLAMYFASFVTSEAMARYTLATTFLLGISCLGLALPFRPDELKRYALAFALATSAVAMWPHALPPLELGLYIVITSLVGIPAWAIARRSWQLNARSFLLDQRDEMTRIELERNNQLLRQLSEQDPLTGLPNRRKFERVVSERLRGLSSSRGKHGKLAVMMIDLDHFKAFNDRHGHQAGDRCLALAAAQLMAVFPSRYGVLARYGGEEFIAAVRERHPGEARELAEEMRAAIAAMLVPVRDDSKPLITTSIGLALAPANRRLDLEDMIEMADVALYSAKRAGRDRVEVIEADEGLGAGIDRISEDPRDRRRA